MASASGRRSLQQPRSPFGVLLLCFFFSGATALVYEVIWLRMLGLVFGHTVYAITTVLAAFMAGPGPGSGPFWRPAPRVSHTIHAFWPVRANTLRPWPALRFCPRSPPGARCGLRRRPMWRLGSSRLHTAGTSGRLSPDPPGERDRRPPPRLPQTPRSTA